MRPRSHEPLFWMLFGAGGTVAALAGPGLVAITGLLVPLGLIPPEVVARERVGGWIGHPLAGAALAAVLSLFLWHGAHRLLHGLRDIGLRPGRLARHLAYGAAAIGTAAAFALAFA